MLASPFADALPAGWDLRGCALAELADGGLLAVVVAIDKTSGRPPYNPVTEGLVPVRNLVARSDDGGATWSEPWDLADGRYVQHASQGLLALPDGGVLCTFETFKTYDDPGVWRYTGGAASLRRWRPDVGSAGRSRRHRTPTATRTTRCGGTRGSPGWRPVSWSSATTRSATRPARRVRSTSRGARTTARPGAPRLDRAARAGDLSPAPPRWPAAGLPAAPRGDARRWSRSSSDDGGRTFDRTSERVVYEHVAESAPGANGSLSAFDYLMSMDRFTFGHPCGVVTGPNEALVFWYAGGQTRTSIRSARLRIG